MRKTKRLKIDDRVDVIVPQMFIRCGYDHRLRDGIDMVMSKGKQLYEFFESMGWNPDAYITRRLDGTQYTIKDRYAMRQLLTPLGYMHNHQNGISRDQKRKIFTRSFTITELEALTDHGDGTFGTLRVIDTRQVVTGDYYPPGGDYEDYEPGGLMNQKHHQIVRLSATNMDQIMAGFGKEDDLGEWHGTWMEATHLRLRVD